MAKVMNNILTWRVHDPAALLNVPELLSTELAERPLEAPGKLQAESTGFVKPAGESYGYVAPLFGPDKAFLIALGIGRRVMSKKAIQQQVSRKAAEIEKAEGRKVQSREKTRIKEQLIEARLPSADIEYSTVYAIVSLPYIFVMSSVKPAEKLLDELRLVLGGLRVTPVVANDTPMRHFTHWFGYGDVVGEGAERWSMGTKFTLHKAHDDKEVVRGTWPFKNDEGLTEWVTKGDQKVTELQLRWQWHSEPGSAEVEFMCNEMLALKGIKWPVEIDKLCADHQGEAWGDDRDADFLTSVAIAHASLREMLTALLALLGGEKVEKRDQDAETAEDDAETTEDDGDLI